jgi:5-methyltetrahydropteroyltriglutamate--homocysteine methyltransferase
MADIHIFRIDHHGSLIRPAELEHARATGVSGDALREAEDDAVRSAAKLNTELRQTQLTDGQYRRDDFRDVLLASVAGFTKTDEMDADGFTVWKATGEISGRGTSVAEAEFLLGTVTEGATVRAVKISLPSPAYLAERTFDPAGPYATRKDLGLAIADVVKNEIAALFAAGVRYVQLDNPDYSAHYSGGEVGAPAPALGVLDAIEVDSAAIADLDKPEDARIGICVDWGQYAADAADEQIAFEVFDNLPFDKFSIPYFDDVFAGQNLIQFIPDGVFVGLGIVDALNPELEDVDAIMARMDQAFSLKDLDEIAISPSRGFQNAAYVAAPLTIVEQNRKLTHVETLARMCWGNEL